MKVTQATSHRSLISPRKWPGFIPLFYSVTGCEQPGGKCNPWADTSVSFSIHHLIPSISYSPYHEINEKIIHGHQITWFLNLFLNNISTLQWWDFTTSSIQTLAWVPTPSPQPLTPLISRIPLMPLIVNITVNSKDNCDVQIFCLGLTITQLERYK